MQYFIGEREVSEIEMSLISNMISLKKITGHLKH